MLPALKQLATDRSFISKYTSQRRNPGLRPKIESRYVGEIISKNPKAWEKVSPDSLRIALLDAAQIGLSLAPTLSHAYLIPRGKTATFVVGYRGLLHLAYKTSSIAVCETQLVHARDDFSINATSAQTNINHSWGLGDRGKIIGVWCRTKLASGETLVELMNEQQIEACKDAMRRQNTRKDGTVVIPPSWRFFGDEMVRKLVVRRQSKYWPMTDALAQSFAHLDRVEPMLFEGTAEDVTDETISDGQLNEVHAMLTEKYGLTSDDASTWMTRKAETFGHKSASQVTRGQFSRFKNDLAHRAEAVAKK